MATVTSAAIQESLLHDWHVQSSELYLGGAQVPPGLPVNLRMPAWCPHAWSTRRTPYILHLHACMLGQGCLRGIDEFPPSLLLSHQQQMQGAVASHHQQAAPSSSSSSRAGPPVPPAQSSDYFQDKRGEIKCVASFFLLLLCLPSRGSPLTDVSMPPWRFPPVI